MSKYRIVTTKKGSSVEARWLNPFFIFDESIGKDLTESFFKVLFSYIKWTKIKSGTSSNTLLTLRAYIKQLQEDERILIKDIKSCLGKENKERTVEYIEEDDK